MNSVAALLLFEEYAEPITPIEREKRVKRMTRAKKVHLIERAEFGLEAI